MCVCVELTLKVNEILNERAITCNAFYTRCFKNRRQLVNCCLASIHFVITVTFHSFPVCVCVSMCHNYRQHDVVGRHRFATLHFAIIASRLSSLLVRYPKKIHFLAASLPPCC